MALLRTEESQIDGEKVESNNAESNDVLLNAPITKMRITTRTRTQLLKLGVLKIGDLTTKSADDLLAMEGIGLKGVQNIRANLAFMNTSLKGERQLDVDESDRDSDFFNQLRLINRLSPEIRDKIKNLNISTDGELVATHINDLREAFTPNELNSIRSAFIDFGRDVKKD